MAKDRSQRDEYSTPLRRLLLGVVCLCLLAIFLIWRIDSPRVERFRSQITDKVVPSMNWAMVPVTGAINLVRDFQSYQRLAEQNRDLRDELRQMQAWKEAALQLEQENARLLDLSNVRLDPRLTFVTGVVMADSGSPFRQSVLLNVGARDGIVDGWGRDGWYRSGGAYFRHGRDHITRHTSDRRGEFDSGNHPAIGAKRACCWRQFYRPIAKLSGKP